MIKYIYKFLVKMRARKWGSDLHINRLSIVSKTTILGNNINFNGMRIVGKGNVIIGDNFHSGRDCLMISQNHNYDNGKAIPYDDSYIPKDIIIGENVWIGDRVIILGGSIIEEGAIIQAGSVVVGKIPSLAIAGGHPAQVFKYRNKEHYYELKEKEKFM